MGDSLRRRSALADRTAEEMQAPIDQEIARSLSSQLADHHRLAFARSFAHAVIRAGWRADDLQPFISPENVELVPLSFEAIAAAARLGSAIAMMPAERATYVVGTVYTTALPEHYRAAHGDFYTPPELVERMLVMSEEAGVKMSTRPLLDPARGRGAFFFPLPPRVSAPP